METPGTRPPGKRISVSGRVSEASGIGVIQRHVYPKLESDFELIELDSREKEGTLGKITGLLRGFFTWDKRAEGSVCMVSPLPFRNAHPLVTVVHDLRWISEAGWLKRLYRRSDLARVVKHSERILCVSKTTYDNLLRLFPDASRKADWAWLGPGILDEGIDYVAEGELGRVLLIGADPRKQNELAVEMLAHVNATMPVKVTGVNLSGQARSRCEQLLGSENCRWLVRPETPDLIREFQKSQYYLLLGTGEGFGLPFVEAMGTGTIPVTMDYELGREVIGAAGVLLKPGNTENLARQFMEATAPDLHGLREHYQKFSWNAFVSKIAEELQR